MGRREFCLASSDVILLCGLQLALHSGKGLGYASRLGGPQSEPLSDIYSKSLYSFLRNHPEILLEWEVPKSGIFWKSGMAILKKHIPSFSRHCPHPLAFTQSLGNTICLAFSDVTSPLPLDWPFSQGAVATYGLRRFPRGLLHLPLRNLPATYQGSVAQIPQDLRLY